MRVLDWSNATFFEFFYEALVISPTKGDNTRKLGKILAKLESVGTIKETKGTVDLYTLAYAATVELEDSEYELAKQLINSAEWNGKVAIRAGQMLEFIESAPTKEQYEARKSGILKLDATK